MNHQINQSKYKEQHPKKMELIQNCMTQFNLPANIKVDVELLNFHEFPKTNGKRLATLLLCYKGRLLQRN